MSRRNNAAIARGPLVADLYPHLGRSQEHGLRQPDVVAVDQPLGGHVVKRQQPVLVAKVGKERRRDGLGLERELAGDRVQNGLAIEPWPRPESACRLSQMPALLCGRGEDLFAHDFGCGVGDNFELGAIVEHLGKAPVYLGRLAAAAEEGVDLALDRPARHADRFAVQKQQAFGDL